AAGLASMATIWLQPAYPAWAPSEPVRWNFECASVELRVAKSGKEGAGVVLEARTSAPSCALRVEKARMVLGSRPVDSTGLPTTFTVVADHPTFVWLPFRFDGDAAWNSGDRKALIQMEIGAGGPPRKVEVELVNAFPDGQQYEYVPRDSSGSRS